jgi:hypothetical protein
VCAEAGYEVGDLVSRPGYWRPAKFTDSFFDCGDAGANCYGGPFEDQCANHSTGPLCKMCQPGYLRRGGICEACPAESHGTTYFYSLFPFGVLFLIAALAKYLGGPDKSGRLTRGLRQDRNWQLGEKGVEAFQLASKAGGRSHRDGKGGSQKMNSHRVLMAAAVTYSATHSVRAAAGGAKADAGAGDAANHAAPGVEAGVEVEVADASQAEQTEDALDELVLAREDAEGAVADAKDCAAETAGTAGGILGTVGLGGGAGAASQTKALAECFKGLRGKLKIFVGWGQCIGGFRTSFSIPWPGGFTAQLDWLSVLSFDFLKVFKPSACDLDTSFFAAYVFTMSVLPAVCTLLAAAYGVTVLRTRLQESRLARLATGGKLGRKQLSEKRRECELKRQIASIRAQKVLLSSIFFLYPGICTKVFMVFDCRSPIAGVQYFMGDDMAHGVVCYEGTHRTYQYLSALFACMYVVGIPLLLFKMLYDRRRQIQNEPDNPVLVAEFGSLYEDYEVRV